MDASEGEPGPLKSGNKKFAPVTDEFGTKSGLEIEMGDADLKAVWKNCGMDSSYNR